MGRVNWINKRYWVLILIGLLTIGTGVGCRSSDPREVPSDDAAPRARAQAAADIIIVEKGSPRLARVRPVPAHIALSPGETIGLSAIAFDQEGREAKRVDFNWQVVDSQVGSITPSGVFRAGFIKGTFKNSLVVTARAPAGMGPGLIQAAASVTVADFAGELEPAMVRVFPEPAEIEPGETLHLLALALDANGVAIPNIKFKWEMLEPLAGSISDDGRLTAGGSVDIFSSAVRVSALPLRGDQAQIISTNLDVTVVDPAAARRRITATILPQVISLRPKEQIRFSTMVLDRRGNLISHGDARWEVLDGRAGVITQRGHFTAGEEPRVYPAA